VRGEVVSVRADVYAASLLVWELLVGRKAIVRTTGPDREVLRAMAEPAFPALAALRPDLPQAVLEAIGRGLEAKPARRTITAAELEALLVSAVDAYTGERLVLTRASGVPLLRAVAASASVPGLFTPQPLLDRRGMDGGVSGTGIHADLVAGSRRALLFPIAGELPEARLTAQPDGVEREVAALRDSGTAVLVCHSRLSPTIDLMDPAEVPGALALGALQAGEDAPALADFWRD